MENSFLKPPNTYRCVETRSSCSFSPKSQNADVLHSSEDLCVLRKHFMQTNVREG